MQTLFLRDASASRTAVIVEGPWGPSLWWMGVRLCANAGHGPSNWEAELLLSKALYDVSTVLSSSDHKHSVIARSPNRVAVSTAIESCMIKPCKSPAK